MKTYQFTIAGNVRAYGTVVIEAEDEEAAEKRAQEIVAAMNSCTAPEPSEMADVVFDAAYDTLDEFDSLEDVEEVQ